MTVEVLKCPHCKYTSQHEGWMKQHIERKHPDKKEKPPAAAGEKNPGGKNPAAEEKCPDCGGTNFELLKKSDPDPRIRLAIQKHGVTKRCTNCKELI